MLDRELLQATSTLENKPLEWDVQGTNRAFHTLLDHSAQMMWLLNPDGVLLDANQTALDFGDASYGQIVGRPLAAVMGWTFPDQEQGRLRAAILSAADGETVRYEADIQGATNAAIFDLTVRPIEQARQPPMLVVEGVNVSDRKRLESHLHHYQRLESLGELTIGIVHDLTNILTPVSGVSQLLQREFPEAGGKQRQLFEILTVNTNRAVKLVRQILHFVKGDTENHHILDIDPLLLSVKQLVQLALPSSVSMQTYVPAGIGQIVGNKNQLHQVFMNLCLNARDAMPTGGNLELSVENVEIDGIDRSLELEDSPTDYVMIRVSDTGSGIPPKVLDRIFEPFFTTKAAGRGTGLGLPTAMDIVKSHGGFIDVISTEKMGTQFLVFLPTVI
ncbi:MAG: two-component system sensor histidine kinase NtrB [Phormidesmis sp.]